MGNSAIDLRHSRRAGTAVCVTAVPPLVFVEEPRRGGVTCGGPAQAQLVICGPVEGFPVMSGNDPGTIRAWRYVL